MRGHRAVMVVAGAAAAVWCAALVVATPSAPASPAVMTSSISVSGTAGNFSFFAPGKANISWRQGLYYQGEYIDVSASTPTGGSQYHFLFGTPASSGQPLAPRFYQWAQDFYGDRGPDRPGIDVTGNSPGCGPQTGWFEVRDIHRVGGEITRLWLVFERWCSPSWVEHGELRLGYPQAAYDVSPRVVAWPWTTVYPGQAAEQVPIKVRLTSPGPVTVGTPSVSGADAGDFPIRRRNCTNVALAEAGCTVWVGFTPTAPGPRHATLTVPTSAGPADVPLDATGGVGTSNWTVD